MSELRRVGGEMVPHRKPAGRRVLLQYEADLCNAVGLTEEEYWYFVDEATAYNGQRAKEYELVPDVRNDPVQLFIANLIIGIALTYIGTLLAPKPKEAPERRAIDTSDVTGRSRFAPQFSFNSVQELAKLGGTIPLVFARTGVRVNSQLLWSQLISRKSYQELRAVMLFSYGQLGAKPDYEGFAIGDTLLDNFPDGKLALYFSDGGGGANRITEVSSQRYPESKLARRDQARDVMSIYWHSYKAWKQYFCGTRTPGTQVEFGVFAPIPNGNKYKVNYELVLVQHNLKGESKESAQQKRTKVSSDFPSRAAITKISSTARDITYKIDDGQESAGSTFDIVKIDDVKQSVDRRRIDADEILALGEQYLFNGCLYMCEAQTSEDIWRSKGSSKSYILKYNETIDGNKPASFSNANNVNRKDEPSETSNLMRAAIGSVSNNRACDATEIGIKSVVWRRINGFANVNTQPSASLIREFEKDNGSIQLGGMTKYVRRASFFKLYARKVGSNNWINITVDAKGQSTYFCVSGQSPREQYNSIRIYTPETAEYEYRIVPFGGNYIRKRLGTRRPVILLTGFNNESQQNQYNGTLNGYQYFCYGREQTLTEAFTNNIEWFVGEPPSAGVGQVNTTNRSTWGSPPGSMQWVTLETRYDLVLSGFRGGNVKATGNSGVIRRRVRIGSSGRGGRSVYVDEYRWKGAEVTNRGNIRYIKGAKKYGSSIQTFEIIKQERRFVRSTPNFQGTINPTRLSGVGTGLRLEVKYWASANALVFTIKEQGAGYSIGDQLRFTVPGYSRTVSFSITEVGSIDNVENILIKNNVIADYFTYDAESSSHQDGPEHTIAYVNEIQAIENFNYPDLAVAGLRLNSGKEWTSFSEFSAYIKKGIKIQSLGINDRGIVSVGAKASSNNFPEIAYALLTDNNFGAGETIGANQVATRDMATAARYCRANGFFWDGVISEKQNLREFIFQNAGYNFLDFTIKGGQFGLFPSFPYNSNYEIDVNAKPSIKALFTDGNMRNMKVSFLTPEERQMFKATVIYREDVTNGFSQNKTVTLTLNDRSQAQQDALPEETFDLSGFCKSREHARKFAKQALLIRRHVDHGLRFETTPQAAMALQPGEYFRVVSEATHTSRFQTGSIGPDGTIIAKDSLANGNYTVYYWKPGRTVVSSTTLTVRNGKAVGATLRQTVFSIKNSTTQDRVYKVETLQYAEDGLVEISGSFVPLRSNGKLQVLDWDESNFTNV